ncbi:MAG: hypothetical protein IKX36_08140 [Prevotella sp.]|nr:hypothetical protein [Prevotella sp.]
MKKWIFLTVIAGVMPFTLWAQDDMYFTPTKPVEKSTVTPAQTEKPTYYSGINQTVDEYNRRHLNSSYQVIGTDSLGNDIIEMTEGTGYPKDTVYIFRDNDDDFAYSRRMGRFDGFYGWYDPFFYDYWYGPWSWTSWYLNDPWYWGYYGYYGLYDPWLYGYGWGYYGWRYGWGWPYYGRYYGWYDPIYYGPGFAHRGTSGTRNHGNVAFGSGGGSRGVFGGSRNSGTFGNRNSGNNTASAARSGVSNGTRHASGGFVGGSRSNVGGSRSSSRSGSTYSGGNRSGSGTFGGSSTSTNRSYGTTNTPSRSSSNSSYGGSGSSSHSSGGGSFGGGGGSRGGGGSFGGGGGSRGGGGSFGGRR